MNKAAYFGSFDPFQNGHLDIVKRASKIFDEVHVVIAFNINKGRRYNPIGIRKAIEQVLKDNHLDNCKATICDSLAIRYCESNDISYMIRGIRNNIDYNYEENIAKVNYTINPDVETIYFRTSDEAISSSTVYEFYKYKEDVSGFIPYAVLSYMKEVDERYEDS